MNNEEFLDKVKTFIAAEDIGENGIKLYTARYPIKYTVINARNHKDVITHTKVPYVSDRAKPLEPIKPGPKTKVKTVITPLGEFGSYKEAAEAHRCTHEAVRIQVKKHRSLSDPQWLVTYHD